MTDPQTHSEHLATFVKLASGIVACLRVDSDGWQRVLERSAQDLMDLSEEVHRGKRQLHHPQHLSCALRNLLTDAHLMTSVLLDADTLKEKDHGN